MSAPAIEEPATTASAQIQPGQLGELIAGQRRGHHASVAGTGRQLKVAAERHEAAIDDAWRAIRAAKDYLSVDDLASLSGLSRPEIYQILWP